MRNISVYIKHVATEPDWFNQLEVYSAFLMLLSGCCWVYLGPANATTWSLKSNQTTKWKNRLFLNRKFDWHAHKHICWSVNFNWKEQNLSFISLVFFLFLFFFHFEQDKMCFSFELPLLVFWKKRQIILVHYRWKQKQKERRTNRHEIEIGFITPAWFRRRACWNFATIHKKKGY